MYMEKKDAIVCENIFKEYPLYMSNVQRLKGLVIPGYKPTMFTALDHVSLTIKKGEILGIVGMNGSGKSTLANIISGITYATSGALEINGEVSMLSVNAGMESFLTGRENIAYKCLLLGFSPSYVKEIEDRIVDFADIGIHIDQPVRTYSSGMRSRLGFSISTHMDPDILIIDEALSVGDSNFAKKSREKMEEFKDLGKTILYVSHGVDQMHDFCDRVLWLHKGRILGVDAPERIISPYCEFARDFNGMTNEQREQFYPDIEMYQKKARVS